MTIENGMRPVHPGEILREELKTLGLSANALSKRLGVPVTGTRPCAKRHAQERAPHYRLG